MKTTKYYLAIIAAATLHGQAFADDGDDSLVGKNWGCTVKLCMQNPKGPMDEPKCRPAIRKMNDEIAKGHTQYPECQGDDTSMKKVWDYYDKCPAGTAAATEGETVVTGVRTDRGVAQITSQPKVSRGASDGSTAGGERACVGAPVGMMQAVGGQYEEGTMLMVYSSVTWQKPYPTPNAMDFFSADGKWLRRVRIIG